MTGMERDNHFPSPYNFVPLSKFVLTPDWGNQVSQDHPFQDGISGELLLDIQATSPLCVGGKQSPASSEQAAKVHFYRSPDGLPAIPGSSLKGMLRNALSIATFGRFNQVEDKRLGVRDISRANNFYSEAMNRSAVHAGWLRFDKGQWTLLPCKSQYVRIAHKKIIEHFGIPQSDWLDSRNKTAIDRYKLLKPRANNQYLNLLNYTSMPYKYDCRLEVDQLNKGDEQGYLVITGQAGPGFDRPKGKQREFVFPSPGDSSLPIHHNVMADFMLIHEESKEWSFWRDQVKDLNPGIPVFFHYDLQKNVKSMGLARMYRLAYENSLHDAIRHTSAAHLDQTLPDLADLIFGHLDEEQGSNSLRGRVSLGLGVTEQQPAFNWTAPTVLSSPKPTFYPAYIRQNTTGKYITLMEDRSELAGWKLYPARTKQDLDVPPAPIKSTPKVQVRLETIPTGTCFNTRLRFHNLKLTELGALLWCLDFGGQDNLRHRIGTGKPLGFGQVQLRYSAVKLRSNQREVMSDFDWLEAASLTFSNMMDSIWQQVTGVSDARWEHSPQVAKLLAMADPEKGDLMDLSYAGEPKAFGIIKNEGGRLKSLVPASEQTLTPKENIQVSTTDIPLADLRQQVEARKEEQEKQRRLIEAKIAQEAEKTLREAEKAEMSDEQRLLADATDLLNQAEAELSTTLEKNLSKAINQIHSHSESYNADDRAIIKTLTLRGEELVERQNKQNGKLAKALKKVRRDILN